jgi:cobalt/nickel transport system permease protein
MHMADALISPQVGGIMWAATAGLIVYCSRKVNASLEGSRVPLMGVLGAFIFAAQMINFTIPATGSSGHLGGGAILAILLGPHAAFLTIASVLTVQSLFFADGGILALGCNIFNLGFWPCFVAFPLLYTPIVGRNPSQGRIVVGAILASIVGLQLGAFSVVLETVASGISELPFETFVMLMQPIHLAIGLVEGMVTAAVVIFVWKARPEVLAAAQGLPTRGDFALKGVLTGLALVALVTGGTLSWFASAHPDGLEWSMAKVSGKEELETPEHGVHALLAEIQGKTAFLPDYAFKSTAEDQPADTEAQAAWPAVDPGTSVSGILGGTITMLLAGAIGLFLKKRQHRA